MSSIKEIFDSFTNGKPEMENHEFSKLFKECGLIDKKFNINDADIIFSKVKVKNAKTINFEQFEKSLDLTAEKKKCSKNALEDKILAHGKVKYEGTKAGYVKLFDDKSTYTGVYARGGPSVVDAGKTKISDISQVCDRTKADVRGVKDVFKEKEKK